MPSNSSPRKRTPKSGPSTDSPSARPPDNARPVPNQGGGIALSFSDAIRVVATIIALGLSLSYYLTSGDSLFFGHRPWFTHLDRLTAYARGPLALTPAELSLYNGTSPSLPILLAIDGTIFDVSASPHTYGPGGSYHAFAGRDASRAFVTGCFEEDLHGDLRGVERMFIPVEDVEEGGGGGEALTSSQKKIRAEQETRESKKKVRAKVENWVAFYRGNKKYFEVGKVVSGSAEGEERKDVPGLCEAAEKARPRRSQLDEEIRKGSGKKVSKPDKGGKPV